MDTVQKHLFLEGRVQGVGFRYFTRISAGNHDVKGWVKNLPDGRVEAVLQGDSESVEEMVKKMKSGPSAARIKNVEVIDETPVEDFYTFEVRR